MSDVSLSIEPGETIGLMGTGKSTLGKVIAGNFATTLRRDLHLGQ
ncbi:ATP-binding cassette domain-containing protein [Phyllobacterium zundukense]